MNDSTYKNGVWITHPQPNNLHLKIANLASYEHEIETKFCFEKTRLICKLKTIKTSQGAQFLPDIK
jgi:hypothetical protein